MGKERKLNTYFRFALPEIKKLFWDGADMKTTRNIIVGLIIIYLIGLGFNAIDFPFFNNIENELLGFAPYIIAAVTYVFVYALFVLPYVYIDRLGGFVEEPIAINSIDGAYDFTGGNDYSVLVSIKTTTPFPVDNCMLRLMKITNLENN